MQIGTQIHYVLDKDADGVRAEVHGQCRGAVMLPPFDDAAKTCTARADLEPNDRPLAPGAKRPEHPEQLRRKGVARDDERAPGTWHDCH